MKTISLKNLCTTTSLLVGLGGMSSAQADVFAGGLAAAPPGRTDVYGITCPLGTAGVRARVNDPANDGIFISVQVVDPQGGATSATAPSPGSAQVGLAGPGAGNYLILVDKGQPGAVAYQVQLDCFNAAGNDLPGIQSALVQDQ